MTKEPIRDRPVMPGYGLTPAVDGAGMLPWSWLAKRMEQARNYWLVTSSAAGRPHSVPVWGVWHEGRFIFAVGPSSQKNRNLAENNRAIVHLESGDEVAIIEGLVEKLEAVTDSHPAAVAYRSKYGVDLTGGVIHQLISQRAFAWLESDFANSATRWRFPAV